MNAREHAWMRAKFEYRGKKERKFQRASSRRSQRANLVKICHFQRTNYCFLVWARGRVRGPKFDIGGWRHPGSTRCRRTSACQAVGSGEGTHESHDGFLELQHCPRRACFGQVRGLIAGTYGHTARITKIIIQKG